MKKANSIDIIFDGECLMCNSFMRYIDSSTRNTHIRINAYPSIEAYSKYNNINSREHDYLKKYASRTIIAIRQEGETLLKSRAIEEIFISCNSMRLKILAKLMKFLPYIIKDFVYELISRVRRSIKFFNNNKCNARPFKSIKIYN